MQLDEISFPYMEAVTNFYEYPLTILFNYL